MAREIRACTGIVIVLGFCVGTLIVLGFSFSLYNDYCKEFKYHEKEWHRVDDAWSYECFDIREKRAQETHTQCLRWEATLQNYETVGIRNMALSRLIDRWGAWYMDGIGTRLTNLGYNLMFYAIMFSISFSILLFCAALLISKITRAFAQSGARLPIMTSSYGNGGGGGGGIMVASDRRISAVSSNERSQLMHPQVIELIEESAKDK